MFVPRLIPDMVRTITFVTAHDAADGPCGLAALVAWAEKPSLVESDG